MIAATSANAMRGERVLRRSGAEAVVVVGTGVDNGGSFDISKIMELSKEDIPSSHERRYGHLHADEDPPSRHRVPRSRHDHADARRPGAPGDRAPAGRRPPARRRPAADPRRTH